MSCPFLSEAKSLSAQFILLMAQMLLSWFHISISGQFCMWDFLIWLFWFQVLIERGNDQSYYITPHVDWDCYSDGAQPHFIHSRLDWITPPGEPLKQTVEAIYKMKGVKTSGFIRTTPPISKFLMTFFGKWILTSQNSTYTTHLWCRAVGPGRCLRLDTVQYVSLISHRAVRYNV